MENIKNNLKAAISALYSKKFFKNYDHLDLTGVDRIFLDQILTLLVDQIVHLPISELGKRNLTKILHVHYGSLSDMINGNDFNKFAEIKRLARGEARVFQVKKSSLKEIKDRLLKDLEQISTVEKSLNPEEILVLFSYVGENIIFQKVTAEKKASLTFNDPSLEEQVVDFWNEHYGVRYEELTTLDFDFSTINESIACSLGDSCRDLLSNSELFIEYEIDPKTIVIKSINGAILFEPVVVANTDPRSKKRILDTTCENFG